ncbi:MAG: UvrB/UvrC motif-containing protein [Phycisphaerales bacterium]
MQCEICKDKTATVHLTEIVQGHRTETHLCQSCAQKEGITVKSQLSLNELLSSLIAAHQQTDENETLQNAGKICNQCGMTMELFRKQALLGCPNDYKIFEDELRDIIEKTQDNNSLHIGKTPPMTGSKIEHQEENTKQDLQRRLDLAVKTEDYELAAKLRDQLKAL